MPYFLSDTTVISAYNQLISQKLSNPNILLTFLILKGCDYDSKTFKDISLISQLGKDYCKRLTYLFSPNEAAPKKYDFINPFSMDSWGEQPISEPLDKWVKTRIKNNVLGGATTWRTIIDSSLDLKTIKFKYNYIEEIKNICLKSKKINLIPLIVWANRFNEFDQQHSISDMYNEFIKFYNLTQSEINELFFIDNNLSLEYSTSIFNCEGIRRLIGSPKNEVDWIESKIITDNATTNFYTEYGGFNYMSINHNIKTEYVQNILSDYKQVLLSGPPGTSKSYICDDLASHYKKTVKIQFHPQYTYQQFIGGFIVNGQNVSYKKGILLEFLDTIAASNSEDDKYLLIIDEINRANVNQVIGEVVQCLDRSYSTQLLIDNDLQSITLPNNLHIVATMNSSDRTVGSLDHAIRRRFLNVYCPPCEDLLIDLCPSENFISLHDLLKKINTRLEKTLNNREFKLGHALFLSDNVKIDDKYYWDFEKFEILFNCKILPMIEEYCYNNLELVHQILGTNLPNRLTDDDFKIALQEYLNI